MWWRGSKGTGGLLNNCCGFLSFLVGSNVDEVAVFGAWARRGAVVFDFYGASSLGARSDRAWLHGCLEGPND